MIIMFDTNFIIQFTQKPPEERANVSIILKKPIPDSLIKNIEWIKEYLKINIEENDEEINLNSNNAIFISSIYLTLAEEVLEIYRSLEITQDLALIDTIKNMSVLYDEHNQPIQRPEGSNIGEKVLTKTLKFQKPSSFSKEEIEEIKEQEKVDS